MKGLTDFMIMDIACIVYYLKYCLSVISPSPCFLAIKIYMEIMSASKNAVIELCLLR